MHLRASLIASLIASPLFAAIAVNPGEDVQKACDAAAASDDKRVILQPGVHRLAKPLTLEPRRNGLSIEGPGATLSGGIPLDDWREIEPGVWQASAPQGLNYREIRILRIGDDWATLARTPNFDPKNPTTGGWLTADKPARITQGRFGAGMAKIHTPGDWLEWDVIIPADGTYDISFFYGAVNAPWGTPSMAGKTQLQVDGGNPVTLQGLDDTKSWSADTWSQVASIPMTGGTHRLRWTNVKGGGLNFDALKLVAGTNEVVIQAETAVAWQMKEGVFPEDASGEVGTLRYREGDVQANLDLKNAEIHMFPAWGWVNAIVYPESIDLQTRTIKLEKTQSASEEIRPGNRYFVANTRAAMDLPGEWCIDRQSGTILLRIDKRPQNVTLPVLKTLIQIAGGDTSVEGLKVTGLLFRDTSCSADFGVYNPADAVIAVQNAHGLVVEGNRFIGVGGYPLVISDKSRDCQVIGNEISNTAQGGVLLTGSRATQPTGTLIAGNWMHDLGRLYKHVGGVYALTASNTRVAHNRIERVPRYAISFKSFDENSYSENITIEFNELLDTNLETNDTGAIETLGRHRREMHNVIRHNFIRDVIGVKAMPDGEIKSPYMTWGIYLDDCSSGTLVEGNIVINTQWGGVCVHGGFNNTIQNNIFIEGAMHQVRYQPWPDVVGQNRFRRNVIYYENESANIIHSSASNWREAIAESDHNLFWHKKGEAFLKTGDKTPAGDFAAWQAAGYDRNSLFADPLLADDDYTLPENSPAYKLGFQKIPRDKIGLAGYDRSWRPVAAKP